MKPFETCFFDGGGASLAHLHESLRAAAVVHLQLEPRPGARLLSFYGELLGQLGTPELRGEGL